MGRCSVSFQLENLLDLNNYKKIKMLLKFRLLDVFFVAVAVPSLVLRNPRQRLTTCWAYRLR